MRLEFEVRDGQQARVLTQRLIRDGWNVDSQIVPQGIYVEIVATKEHEMADPEGFIEGLDQAKVRTPE